MIKFLKSAFTVFRSVRKQLSIIFGVALVLEIGIEFKLKHVFEARSWTLVLDGANLLAHLLRSYMASYIFFLVGAQWDKIANRKLVAPRVNVRLWSMLLDFKNLLVVMTNIKARTSFSERAIVDITRKEWPVFVNEVFWLQENYEDWTPPCFVHMINKWGDFGENSRDQSDQIATRFDDFDPKLTVLMDEIHYHSRQLIWLRNSNESYMNFEFGERTNPLPQLENFVFQRCFAMHESIKLGVQLVQYCRGIDDPFIRIGMVGCDEFLALKGRYNEDQK